MAGLRYKAKKVCDRRYKPGTDQYKACIKDVMKGLLRSKEYKRDRELRKQGK